MAVENKDGAQGTATSEEKQFVTADQLGEILNKAITGHLKRLPKSLAPEELDKFLDEREQKRAESAAEAQKGKGDSEVEKLRKQIEKLAKENAETRAENAKSLAAKRDSDGRMALTQELEKGGITGQRQRHALNHLRAENLVKFGAGDALVFAKGDEELELSAGIADWLKTEDGKHFLPPSGSGGSGSGSSSRTPQRSTSGAGDSKSRAAAALLEAMGRGG